ncbi:MAG TPA: cardiolipin synthase [Candidatus Binatia bacterium]|jgi:cardiolipin synthase
MRRAKLLLVLVLVTVGCAKVLNVEKIPPITLGEASFFPTIEAHTDAAITAGNKVDLLLNGDGTFPLMLREIKNAKSTITMAQYLVEDGKLATTFVEAFAERCRAGVEVKLLWDDHGASGTGDLSSKLTDAGCRVERFRRIEAPALLLWWKLLRYNYRSHRRILVIDGKIGFTGGYGISDAWTGDGHTPEHWRDTNVRVEGPAVKFLQAAFSESWLETTGEAIGGDGYFPRPELRGNVPAQVVRSSPISGSFQNYMLYLLSINSAKKSILITNPYFIPDDNMRDALIKAVQRGVRVAVLAPGKLDSKVAYTASRSGYGPLLKGGVKIFEYQPALLHAKTMVVDSVWATVGSSNFDNRSFALNQEINLTVYNPEFAAQLEAVFEDDIKHADPVTYAEWKSRGIGERMLELFAFPIKEQL